MGQGAAAAVVAAEQHSTGELQETVGVVGLSDLPGSHGDFVEVAAVTLTAARAESFGGLVWGC